MGIEPTQPAWKAGTLPLSYTRIEPHPQRFPFVVQRRRGAAEHFTAWYFRCKGFLLPNKEQLIYGKAFAFPLMLRGRIVKMTLILEMRAAFGIWTRSVLL